MPASDHAVRNQLITMALAAAMFAGCQQGTDEGDRFGLMDIGFVAFGILLVAVPVVLGWFAGLRLRHTLRIRRAWHWLAWSAVVVAATLLAIALGIAAATHWMALSAWDCIGTGMALGLGFL